MVEEDPDGLLYLEREVNVLKGMRHPNIVQFIGISLVSVSLIKDPHITLCAHLMDVFRMGHINRTQIVCT